MLLLALALAVALVVAAAAWLHPLRPRRRVLVTLLDDSALAGVLWSRRGPYLVLRGFQVVEAGQAPVAADGEAVVHRGQIRYVQVIGRS